MTLERILETCQIKGYVQKISDGTWGACYVISYHGAEQVIDELLPKVGLYFNSKEDAEKAGLEKGITEIKNRYPFLLNRVKSDN